MAEPSLRCCSRCHAIYRADFARCPTDGAPLELREIDPLIGSTLGEHYEVDGFIGEGGMGRVYSAHHTRLQRRQFAIKVLLGDLAATMSTPSIRMVGNWHRLSVMASWPLQATDAS